MARYTSKQTTVTITDVGAGKSMTVGPGEGDFNLDNLAYDNSSRVRRTISELLLIK